MKFGQYQQTLDMNQWMLSDADGGLTIQTLSKSGINREKENSTGSLLDNESFGTLVRSRSRST